MQVQDSTSSGWTLQGACTLQQEAYKIDIPRDKYSVSDIFNVKDLSPYHGDEEFDPRTDLPQGRGDDAEHPKVIPMDPTTFPMTPLGPMTRAHGRALENELTSLLPWGRSVLGSNSSSPW